MAQYQYSGCGDSPTPMIDGLTYIYFGAASGPPTQLIQIASKEYNAGCAYVTNDIQNTAASGAGDVNGDGYADVILGGSGGAHLLLGGTLGLSHVDLPSVAPATAVGGVGSVTGTGTPPLSSFVVVSNGQIYRFTGTGTSAAQQFSSAGATTVTRVIVPARRGSRPRTCAAAL